MVSACRFVWSPWQLCITASPPALVPVCLHDHLYACFKLMFGERKKKCFQHGGRKEGEPSGITFCRETPRCSSCRLSRWQKTQDMENTWKAFRRWRRMLENVTCMGTEIGNNAVCYCRAVSEKHRRLPPPDRRRKTLFVCASLLEQSCAFIALMDCCVSALLCACPHVHFQGCPHVFGLSHIVVFFLAETTSKDLKLSK